MKKILGLLLLASALLFTQGCVKRIVDTTCTISGIVLDKVSGQQLPNASVLLTPSGINKFTGSDGSFEFVEITPGQYTLTVQKDGYHTDRKTVTIYAGATELVTITIAKLNF